MPMKIKFIFSSGTLYVLFTSFILASFFLLVFLFGASFYFQGKLKSESVLGLLHLIVFLKYERYQRNKNIRK